METTEFKRIVFNKTEIETRVQELGAQICRDYIGKELVLVCLLKGSMYFFADLTRCIDIPIELDFMSIGIYSNSQTGVVRITKDLDIDVSNKHVLVIEDIIRTGLTTGYLVKNLESRAPKSVKVCTLLISPQQQLINVPVEYFGFKVSNTWLVGYGLDINGKWRNLPFIAQMPEPHV